ncbi:MAG: GWxTD domain-containing protein [Candidatus Aminicenantaceae bacterium]
MKVKFLFCVLSILPILPLLLQAEKKPELPSIYKKWMKEEVVYIITPKEKEVFYKLENNKQRDMFIEEFWRQRDPTPGTSRNEYKEEHYRRIEYANKNFGRGTPFQGWKTDRGKIYIKLGESLQIVRFEEIETYPVEIWYYQGNPKFGQTPIFRLLFFKKYGGGEYEIYSPLSDGPKKLVPIGIMYRPQSEVDPEWQDKVAFNILKERVSLELAESSLSNFPGREGWEFRLPSDALIHEVDIYPHKKVEDDYAYEFLEHTAIVEVSYSVHYMLNYSKVNVLQDKSGIFFVNYAIEPENLSVDFYQDKYLTNLKISTRVTESEGKTIFQQERNIPIELKKNQIKNIGKRPFHLCDSFPLIPGNYTFNLLLENTVTKEFTSFEKNISVPDPKFSQISSLILARKVNRESPYNQVNKAFQIGNLQIYPSPRDNFSQKDRLFIFFQVYGLSQELRESGILDFTFYRGEQKFQTTRKKFNDYENDRDFLQEISLEKFPPGRYKIHVSILNREGEEILSEREEFSVSSEPTPEAWIVTQTNPPADDPLYFYLLGNQFLNRGEIRRAHNELEKAYYRKPDSLDFSLSYTRALLIQKEYQKVKEILLPFSEAKKENFALFYYLGKAFQKEGDLEEAITYYQKALSHKGNVIEILNSIGECYFLSGNNRQALQAWQKSLEINPNQENIRKIIKGIKKEK